MKTYWQNLLLVVVCAAGLGYYIYQHIDWNPPKSKRIFSVQINGRAVLLRDVEAVQIPPVVYDSMAENPKWKEFLLGDQKRVLLFTWEGCLYARAFKQTLESVFQYPQISRSFKQDIVLTGQTSGGSCRGELADHCPLFWLLKHCFHGFCIINPQTKEAIEDHSKDPRQILPLLAAYSSWGKTPLLN